MDVNKKNNSNINKIISLEHSLKGINVIFAFFVLFIIFISLYLINRNVFTEKFIYSIIFSIVLIFIFLGIWTFYYNFKKANPTKTIKDIIDQYGKFKTLGICGLLAAVIIGLIFGNFGILGVFSGSSSNNTTTLIFYILIIGLLGITGIFVKKMNDDDIKILNQLPADIQQFNKEYRKYVMIFLLYLFINIGIYLYNPYEIMTKYGGSAIFIIMFIGLALLAMIGMYGYLLNPQNSGYLNGNVNNVPAFTSFLKGIYILAGLAISAGFFYWILKILGFLDEDNDKNSKNYIISTIINLVLLIGMFSIIYKTLSKTGFMDRPIIRLIFNTILYIPCLLVVLTDYIASFFRGTSGTPSTPGMSGSKISASDILGITTKNDVIFLGAAVSICGIYLLMNYVIVPYSRKKYYKQGGTQLINQPVKTNVLTNVATYQSLNDSDNFNYKYAISFWFYIDALPPSTNVSYQKAISILSYGENPNIKYYAPDNSLIITTKQTADNEDIVTSIQKLESNIKAENINDWNSIQSKIKSGIEYVKTLPIGNESDENGNRIIYKKSNVLLQKWNNIVINYNGGTLDIFYNGELVKSAIEVVSKLNYDMLVVGSENGIIGNVANLLYFKTPLDILTINKLYVSLKDSDPPSISHVNQTLIPLPNQY
jgi:hypothetical protein